MNPLRKIKNLSNLALKPRAIEAAVEAFVRDSHTEETGADPIGLYRQTLENIAASTLFSQNDAQQFWMADEDGDVISYAMCHISKDVDNQLCYWITQAWVHPKYRGSKQVKEWFQVFRSEAKKSLCKHIIVPSSRGVEGYCRFLGKNWKPYVTLLKEDI